MDEKQYTEGISVNESKTLKKLDNFWYHYKWPTIISAFFLIVFIICIAQSCSKEDRDIIITYAGPTYFTVDQKGEFSTYFEDSVIGDYNGDGEKIATFSAYFVYSEEQIKDVEKEVVGTDAAGSDVYEYVDISVNTSELDAYESQLQTGTSSVLLLDGWLYETLKENGRLMALSDVYGKDCSLSTDGYGVRLGDTELYKESEQLQRLPEDTVVCLHKKILGQKKYDHQISAFKDIIGFED